MNTPDRDFVIAELERMMGDSLVGRAAIALISAQAPKPASAGGELDRIADLQARLTRKVMELASLEAAIRHHLSDASMGADIASILDNAMRCIFETHGRRDAIAAESDTAKESCGDVCKLARSTGVICAEGECDIASDHRRAKAADRLAPIEARGVLETIRFHLRRGDHVGADGHRCTQQLLDAIEKAIRARESAPAVEPVPDGWALVPHEPTQEMLDAASSAQDSGDWIGGFFFRRAWPHMLAAAPKPPRVAVTDEPNAAKGIILALAMFVAAGSARADSLRVDAAGIGVKYEGAVAAILEPTATSPAVLIFQQGSGLPIGGGPQLPPRPGSVPFVLEFSRPDGSGVALACVAPPPAFDGAEFHAHFVCKVQPE